MKTMSTVSRALTCALFIMALSTLAQAQATRTWVSGVGDDVNPCSRTAPCKTYAGAIIKTAVHGEISTLDPGGFGAVTITKSITIEGTQGQGYGSILHSGTTGVSIPFDNFTAVGEVQKSVRLRNLNINGSGGAAGGTGLRAIRITGGVAATNTEVFIEDCVIDGSQGSPGRGIEDLRSGGGELTVLNTTIRNTSGTAIAIAPASGSIRIDASLTNVRVFNCFFGIVASSGSRVIVTNSVVHGSDTGAGFSAESPNGGTSELHISNSVSSRNSIGILQSAGATIRVANSDIVYNTTAVSGTVLSYGTNRVSGGAGTLTAIGAASSTFGQQ